MPDYNINLTIQNIWSIIRAVIDISIMWLIIYYAIKFVRNNNRTIQIFKGIIAVVLVNGAANLLGLTTVAYFSNMIISWGFLAAIIIFQPEIRGILEKIGKTNAFSRLTTLLANEKEELVEQLYDAAITLSKNRVGALISIEQSQSMQDYIKAGIKINASVTKELLCSIFMTTTPLHDGAVIIQGDKIACASAYFPPTSINLSSRYGARHRAALGIAEVTDALTIVVSEETSQISIAEHGSIFSVDEKQLRDYLRRVICNDEIEIHRQSKQRDSLLISDEAEVVIDKDDNNRGGFFSNIFSLKKDQEKEQNDSNDSNKCEVDMKVPFNNRYKYDSKQSLNQTEPVSNANLSSEKQDRNSEIEEPIETEEIENNTNQEEN